MNVNKRLIVPLCVFVLAAGSAMLAQSNSFVLERVLVRVNGEILTQTQLTQMQIDACRDKTQSDDKAVGCSTTNDTELKKVIAELTPDILVYAVDELLLVQRARELGVKFSDELFKQGLDNIKKTNNLDDEGLKKAMEQAGLSLDILRSRFEKSYLRDQVQREEIGRRMQLTEEEMRQYYSAHKDQFMTDETVTIRELFMSVPTTRGANGQDSFSQADDAAVKAKMEAARDRAAKGEDFVALVTQLSEAGSKANGGLMGTFKVMELNPLLKDLLDKLKPGEVTIPVRAPRGYQIFKLDARAVPELQPFDKVKVNIQQRIYEDRLEGETQKLLTRLRGQALIEWKDDTYKQMYEKKIAETKDK